MVVCIFELDMKLWSLKIFVGHVIFGHGKIFVGHVSLVMENFVGACNFWSWKILLGHVILVMDLLMMG